MTQWGVVRVLAMAAFGFSACTSLMLALGGETLMALVFGVLTFWNLGMYMAARGK